MLIKGVDIEVRLPDGELENINVRVIDFTEPENNDFF